MQHCVKEDVCSFKNDMQEVFSNIISINEKHNELVDISISCKKWFLKTLTR